MNLLPKIRPESYLKGLLYSLLLTGLYYSSHRVMISWWRRADYTYCYLVPFIILYLIWEKRNSLRQTVSHPEWAGLAAFLVGLLFFWMGELGGEFYTLYISSWLVMVGLCWLHMGWQKLKAIWFPLFISLAMFPLPNFLNTKITLKLKLLSSELGVAMMQLWGMSAYREGNIIDLGFTQLQVVDACSGLRYFFPLIVLGILLAYFYRARFWKSALIVISTAPLSIITNSLRIALTGILYEFWGAEVAESFFHGFSGWFIFMFSLGILLLEMWALNKIFPKTGEKISLKAKGEETTEEMGEKIRNSKFEIRNFFSPPQFVVAVILLGATLAISHGVEFREKIPMKKSFVEFPLKVDKWIGVRRFKERKIIDALDLSDYAIVNYEDPEGRSVNFYVAYYETQRKGGSIHSPSTCLPGSGWIFNHGGEIDISTSGYNGGSMRVRRAYMQKGAYRQLSYYWFPQRGRILTNAYQLKIYNFWDALTKHRSDGALVRVITPVYEGESPQKAEERLQGFVRKIVPILNQYL
ncbi:MAG: VPLPA-CTERM-specific exosortase XrtD [Deltaproteobacteria bacterium]|nr:VPLPA-CTERM-specific exosortase XrtD [Deltaproteobacteria bacterium]